MDIFDLVEGPGRPAFTPSWRPPIDGGHSALKMEDFPIVVLPLRPIQSTHTIAWPSDCPHPAHVPEHAWSLKSTVRHRDDQHCAA